MPNVQWGNLDVAGLVDDFDRESVYTPYKGPILPDGTYLWQIKRLLYVPATGSNYPQFRAGLELVPREGRDETRFAGYYQMAFLSISDNPKARPFWVPFFDAIGVNGRELQTKTNVNSEGEVLRIGKWRNTGDTLILAKIAIDKNSEDGRRRFGWYGEYDPKTDGRVEEDLDDSDVDDEDGYDDDGWDEE